MKKIYLLISKHRKTWMVRYLRKVVFSLYYALENKNNDHSTNGEIWLLNRLSTAAGGVVFDVGANIGKWSRAARNASQASRIYAFEPMPEVFKRLKANLSGFDNLYLNNVALSDKKGLLTFNYYPNSILLSSIYSHFRGGKSEQVQVEAVDGDNFCEENNIPFIDFLKIDAEGSEHLILEGFKKMLSGQRVKAIQFEYGTFSIDSKFLLKDFYTLFTGYGYILGKIYPNHIAFGPYDWTMENFIGPNYLAVRSEETELINYLK